MADARLLQAANTRLTPSAAALQPFALPPRRFLNEGRPELEGLVQCLCQHTEDCVPVCLVEGERCGRPVEGALQVVGVGVELLRAEPVDQFDNSGVLVGKGDVQTALGYANDAAFQKDASKATFTVKTSTLFKAVGVQRGVAVEGVIDPSTVPVTDITMGTAGPTAVKTVIATPKISGNKVTGYNLTGTTGEAISSGFEWNVDCSLNPETSGSCPGGEAFAGRANGASFSNNFTTAGDLTVGINNNTAVLPNTL